MAALQRVLKNGLYLLALSTIVCLFLYYKDLSNRDCSAADCHCPTGNDVLQNIPCVTATAKQFNCKLDAETEEIYVPFHEMIEKQFEITGNLKTTTAGGERPYFEWLHSYSALKRGPSTYSPSGGFLTFADYKVERRDRVKLISAVEQVPMSIQWDEKPYFYAVQIAQFGLQHYSMELAKKRDYQTCRTLMEDHWTDAGDRSVEVTAGAVQFSSFKNEDVQGTKKRWFETRDALTVMATQPISTLSALQLDVEWNSDDNSNGFWVDLKATELGDIFRLHFILGTAEPMWHESAERGGHMCYGMGRSKERRVIVRNLQIDLEKSLTERLTSERGSSVRLGRNTVELLALGLRGVGTLHSAKLCGSAHTETFINAAQHLLRTQDSKGGWPVASDRKLTGKLQLSAGWYSAMAQGHAMSLFVRAYNYSNDVDYLQTYLQAALKATKLLEMPSADGGVRAELYSRAFYEEYPTTPHGTFVLNGFMYTLLGLFDLAETLRTLNSFVSERQRVIQLYDDGVKTLRDLLPLYDNGHGTFYDLRHVSILGLEPNRARWDYHTLHVYLLDLFALLTRDKALRKVADRWADYTTGARSRHN